MKRTLISLLLIGAVSVAAFANGNAESSTTATKTETASKPSVRLLTDATGIDDKSFNAAAWRGILKFYGETWDNTPSRGSLYDVVTAASQDMYIPNLKNAADAGYDLIITTGFTWADALGEVAKQYPDQKFMIVDVNWVNQPNVREYVYTEEQGSYLVGVVAASQAIHDGIQNPRFGFIGGVPGATITKFEMGYIQGIKSILPNAQVVDYYANSWGAPELAKAQAKSWYDNGVYCIFSAAGGTGNGTISQAKEMRLAGKNVWAIGVDSDQYEDGIYADGKSAVLTSMLKLVENSTLDALNRISNNTWAAGQIVMSMKDGGVGYSQANKKLDKDAIDAAEKAKAAIIKGDIKVYGVYKDALAAGAVPAGLHALDD
ncbi:MAG: BMP family ABC transporter substrate-binding protein [Spirochaetia bacterium]|jgi:basic membrane protein A|nr:BMP family ABC transporter substrate-binding protein [Spirochaetia bacterium]